MLVVYQAGRQESAELVEDELEMMGFSVASHASSRDEASTSASPRVLIVLPEEGGAQLRRADSRSWKHVPQANGERPDHLALRTSELARAWLLEAEESNGQTAPPTSRRRASATTMQVLLLNGYGTPAGGLTQDVSIWWGRFGLGPIASFGLTRQLWNADRKKFSLRMGSLGLVGKISLSKSLSEPFEAQMLGAIRGASMFLREDGGKDEDRFRANAWGMQAGCGVDLGFRATRHVRLGGQAWLEGVTMFSWPEDEQQELGGKEADLLVDESEQGVPRYQVTLALGAALQW